MAIAGRRGWAASAQPRPGSRAEAAPAPAVQTRAPVSGSAASRESPRRRDARLCNVRVPCAFRTGAEHQVRGGDGRESDGPAPSSFQHQTGRKVTRAHGGREEDLTSQSPSLSQENGSLFPIVRGIGFKFVARSRLKLLQVQVPLLPPRAPSTLPF